MEYIFIFLVALSPHSSSSIYYQSIVQSSHEFEEKWIPKWNLQFWAYRSCFSYLRSVFLAVQRNKSSNCVSLISSDNQGNQRNRMVNISKIWKHVTPQSMAIRREYKVLYVTFINFIRIHHGAMHTLQITTCCNSRMFREYFAEAMCAVFICLLFT